MPKKKASEIFRPVDPDLRIIEGHRRASRKDWEKSGGALCSQCGEEALRFLNGVCLRCVQRSEAKDDKELKKKVKQLKYVKQHNARIDKKKRTTNR